MRHQHLRLVLSQHGGRRHLASMLEEAFPITTLCGATAVRTYPEGRQRRAVSMKDRLDCAHCAQVITQATTVGPKEPYPQWYKIWIT
jgi:hypothetical protein